MSRRNSKANLRTNASQESGEISFHFETGKKYRPYTSVERIKSIDAKKQSKDDPRLANISKEVPRQCMGVFSINETTSEDTVPQRQVVSPSSIGTIKIEECESNTMFPVKERDTSETFTAQLVSESFTYPEQEELPQQMEYFAVQSQNSISRYQHEENSFVNNSNPGSLAISTDFTQFFAAPVQHPNLFFASTISTPVNELTLALSHDIPDSPTTSYSSSPAESDISYYAYDSALFETQSPFIHQYSSMVGKIDPMDFYQNSQYPDEIASAPALCVESSYNQWPIDPKIQHLGLEQINVGGPMSFHNERLSYPNGFR